MKLLITTSTFPVSDDDKVPAFVKDQAISLKKRFPENEILIHAPHNSHSQTWKHLSTNEHYKEYRFHYFWPWRWEQLAGRGIVPALRKNKFLYFQIPFLVMFQFFSLLRLTYREKPDVIYAHWFTPQAITSAVVSKITGTPIAFTTHASDVAVLHKFPLSKKLVRWVCNRAFVFTAVSQRTALRLKAFINDSDWQNNISKKLHIIPMGVHTSLEAASRKLKEDTRERFNLSTGTTNILFLGRLEEIKGIEYLIEGFSMLPQNIRDKCQLIIAGDGQQKDILMNKVKQTGLRNIVFTGYVYGDIKSALFELSNIVCVPSIVDSRGHMEGLPVVIMEGAAAGKIILASDASGGELIINDGKDGFIFKQKSAPSLSKALENALKLSSDEKKNIQMSAKKLARQFDWSTIADKHYAILNK